MRAIVLSSARATPEVREIPEPVPPPDGVVVQVHATGLCRSDWHAWAGHDDIAFPHVPGHELAGVVTDVGAQVRRWREGDRVTVPFVCGCGRCHWCRTGQAQVCPDQQQPGFTHDGSFAEQVALHAADTNLVAVPPTIELTTAASLGCRFATAYRAVVDRARVAPEEWVSVVGAGGVGLSVVMVARARGARVVAVDRNPQALAVAAGLGAEHTVLADGTDVPAAIHDLTGGGSHVAVDAVGGEQTCRDALLGLRRRRAPRPGRAAAGGGRPPSGPAGAGHRVGADLLGSHGMPAVDYPAMLALIEQGSLAPERLVERTVGLQEAADLLPVFDRAVVAGMTLVDPRR